MQIIVERTENPAQSFWIWDEKITNKSEGRIYPSTTSNVGSGISVAVFQIDENENRTRIAQLELLDYEKLHEYYSTGKKINLDYTYMLLVILVTIVLFGTLYYFAPFLSYHGAITWLDYVYTSGITFFAVGYGDLYPLNVVTKMVSLVEAFLGVTAMSYFLVLLSRKVIR